MSSNLTKWLWIEPSLMNPSFQSQVSKGLRVEKNVLVGQWGWWAREGWRPCQGGQACQAQEGRGALGGLEQDGGVSILKYTYRTVVYLIYKITHFNHLVLIAWWHLMNIEQGNRTQCYILYQWNVTEEPYSSEGQPLNIPYKTSWHALKLYHIVGNIDWILVSVSQAE